MEQTNHAVSRVFDALSDICAICPKHHNARVSAAIIYKRRIISVGTNTGKSDPWQQRFSKHADSIYLHAEIQAIKRAHTRIGEEKLRDATLYVCRLTQSQDGKRFYRALARPCEGCRKAIAEFGIKRVYYTVNTTEVERWSVSDIWRS